MRILQPLSRVIRMPRHGTPMTNVFSCTSHHNSRLLDLTNTRSFMSSMQNKTTCFPSLTQMQTGRNIKCLRGNRAGYHIPIQQSFHSVIPRSLSVMALSVRNLMTQANRQQDPVLKYSGDNDNHITPQEYKIRVGTAIRTLREELPHFFENGLRTTSIYAPNIRLIEGSHTNMSLQGKLLYCWLAKAVRGSFKAWFRDIEFEIQSIRVNDRGGRGISGHDFGNYSNNSMSMNTLTELEQKSTTVMRQHGMDHNSGTCVEKEKKCDTTRYTKIDGINISRGTGGMNEGEEPSIPGTTVTVRWALKGTARSSLVLTTSGPTSPPPSSYSGLFVYEFNDRGLIDEHRIENIIPSPSSMAIRTITLLLSQSRPAATATFDDVSESRKRLGFD